MPRELTGGRASAAQVFGLCVLALTQGCVATVESGEPVVDGDDVAGLEAALTAVPPGVRPTIWSFTPAQRKTLADAILAFITKPILDEHANAHDWHHPADGELFFIRHHEYLNKLETYLKNNNFPQFIPVPMWDPGTAIPSEFLVFDSLVAPQSPMNANPNQPIPSEYVGSRLCNFANATLLAQDVEDWHDGVHGAVGGAMRSIDTAPGAPIFWLWHGLLDDLYHSRTWYCETLPGIVTMNYYFSGP